MTLEDILYRLTEIQKHYPEMMQQEAKYGSVEWDGDRPFIEETPESIDEITLAYDPEEGESVWIFHP